MQRLYQLNQFEVSYLAQAVGVTVLPGIPESILTGVDPASFELMTEDMIIAGYIVHTSNGLSLSEDVGRLFQAIRDAQCAIRLHLRLPPEPDNQQLEYESFLLMSERGVVEYGVVTPGELVFSLRTQRHEFLQHLRSLVLLDPGRPGIGERLQMDGATFNAFTRAIQDHHVQVAEDALVRSMPVTVAHQLVQAHVPPAVLYTFQLWYDVADRQRSTICYIVQDAHTTYFVEQRLGASAPEIVPGSGEGALLELDRFLQPALTLVPST